MADGLYFAVIRNNINKPLRGLNKELLLTKKEQAILLTQHLLDLVDKKLTIYILKNYVIDNCKVKNDEDLIFEMLIATDTMKKVESFLKNMPKESHKFFKQKFIFNKEFDPIQKTFVMQWLLPKYKATDYLVASMNKKFTISETK